MTDSDPDWTEFWKVLTAIDDDSKSSNSLSNLTKGLLMSEDKLNGDILKKNFYDAIRS